MGAGFPLPALHVNPPQDPAEGMQRILAMKGMMQQQQLQGVQLQQQQMALKQKQALQTLFVKHNGDLDKVIADGPQAGIMPDTLQQLQLHNIDVKTKTADLVSKQGENAVKQADLMQGAHDTVTNAPAEQRPAVYQQQLQALQKMGVDVSQMPPQYPGDDEFKLAGAMVKGHKQLVEDAFKASEGAKNTAQAGEAGARTEEVKANTAKIQAEMNFYKQKGLAPGVPLDAQEAADWMQKNPGKTVSDYMQFKARLVPTTTFNLQNSVPKGADGQPSATAQAIANGSMKWSDVASPRMPLATKEALLKEIKAINPNFNSGDFTVEQKVKEAFTSGKPAEELTAFNTAIAHADLLKKAADALNNGDVRGLNTVGNTLGVQFGSDKQTNFRIIADAYTREVNKALTSGHVTDSEIKEIGGTIPANASPAQLAGAVQTYRALMASKVEQRKNQYEAGKKAQPNFGGQPTPAPSTTGGFDWNKFPKVNQ